MMLCHRGLMYAFSRKTVCKDLGLNLPLPIIDALCISSFKMAFPSGGLILWQVGSWIMNAIIKARLTEQTLDIAPSQLKGISVITVFFHFSLRHPPPDMRSIVNH
jgi:hypothetical protein